MSNHTIAWCSNENGLIPPEERSIGEPCPLCGILLSGSEPAFLGGHQVDADSFEVSAGDLLIPGADADDYSSAPQKVRSPVVLARATAIALAAAGLAGAGAAGLEWSLRQIRLGDATPTALAALGRTVDRLDSVSGLLVLSVLFAIPLFIAWMYRAHRNLSVLSRGILRFRSGWAIGGWFVPLLNLIRPKEVMDEIWMESDPEMVGRGRYGRLSGPSRLVSTWWIGWVVVSVGGRVIMRLEPTSFGAVNAWLLASVVQDVGVAFVSLLAIWVVLATTQRQIDKAGLLGVDLRPLRSEAVLAVRIAGSLMMFVFVAAAVLG